MWETDYCISVHLKISYTINFFFICCPTPPQPLPPNENIRNTIATSHV